MLQKNTVEPNTLELLIELQKEEVLKKTHLLSKMKNRLPV